MAQRFAQCDAGQVVMPLDAAAGMAYGPIRLASREARKGPLDKMSAAHAKAL